MTGRALSHYRVIEEIGRGGMGVVYRAHDVRLNRDVALKVLPAGLVADPERRQRFVQEARAAAALNHPHLAVIYEIDEVNGETFIAMELLDGEKLSDILADGALPLPRAIELAVEMAEGMARAHEHRVVHRDLKPSNVMVSGEGHAKIIDFGLAKLLEERGTDSKADPRDADTRTSLETEAGLVMGTVAYMSPEQARGLRIDHRTDVFSLGVVLFQMVTGRRPFEASSPIDTLSAVLRDSPPRLSIAAVSAETVAALQQILDKCLAKDRSERYQGMADLVVDLRAVRRLLESGSGGPFQRLARPSVTKSAGASRRLRAAVAAVAGLTVLGLAAIAIYPRSVSLDPEDRRSAQPPAVPRRSVAVVGFKNLAGRADVAWLSTALAEMITTELAASETLRTIPGENVSRMKLELALVEAESYAPDSLARIRRHLGADLVVLGSYVTVGAAGAARTRVDLRLQDSRDGQTIAQVSESGMETELLDIVSRAGRRLRDALGLDALAPAAIERVRASQPATAEAARLYAEGLSRLRRFDTLAARELFERTVAADPRFPLAHLALARAWSALGYDQRARLAATRAFELVDGLPREERLSIEGAYREMTRSWKEAIEIYLSLVTFFPDNLEYSPAARERAERGGTREGRVGDSGRAEDDAGFASRRSHWSRRGISARARV